MRIWITALVLAVSAVASEPQAPASTTTYQSDARYQWRLVTAWPKNLPGLGLPVERFASEMAVASNKRLRVKVYGAGELVPGLQVFDAVASGTAQMYHAGAYYWKGKIPATVFFTAVPFGAIAPQHSGWIHHGGGLAIWRELYRPFGLRPYLAGNTGTQMAGWFRNEIRSANDVRGLRIRAPGMGGDVLNRLGATTVTLPGGELYTALQTGVIDAAEWVGPYNDAAIGLDQVASYYYYPGWHEPGASLELVINQGAWETLPADLQALLEASIVALHVDMHTDFIAYNGAALKKLRADGIKVQQLPDDMLRQLRVQARVIFAEAADKNEGFARARASFDTYMQSAVARGLRTEGLLPRMRHLQRRVHE